MTVGSLSRLRFWLDLNDSGVWGNEPNGVDDTPVVRSTEIRLDGSWTLGNLAVRSLTPSEIRAKRLRVGDLVVVKSSGSPDHLGKAALVTPELEELDACFSNFVQRLRPSRGADPRFVWYLLNSKLASEEMAVLGNTSTGLRNLNADVLGAVSFPGFALSEQRIIADFLDAETARIDALIAKKSRLKGSIVERTRSAAVASLLGGVNPLGAVQSTNEIGSTISLGNLVTLHRGFDLPDQDRINGPVPVVSSGGVSGSHFEAAPGCSGPGVVTGRYGTIGQVSFVDGPFWPLNTTLFVSDFRGNDPLWVSYLLSVLPLDFDSAKSAVTGINRNVIGSLRVPVRTLREQMSEAAGLRREFERAQNLHVAIDRQVALLQERRQALITAAVTGQMKIPGVAA